MTKVQRKFRLEGALDERIMSRIADAHSIYGVLRVQLESSLDQLLVEYDASRLKLDEVEASLRPGSAGRSGGKSGRMRPADHSEVCARCREQGPINPVPSTVFQRP
jgi:hypothetical protein